MVEHEHENLHEIYPNICSKKFDAETRLDEGFTFLVKNFYQPKNKFNFSWFQIKQNKEKNKRFMFLEYFIFWHKNKCFSKTQHRTWNSTSVINWMFNEEIVLFVRGCILFILFSAFRLLRNANVDSARAMTRELHERKLNDHIRWAGN